MKSTLNDDRYKLNDEDVVELVVRRWMGESQASLAERFGISKVHVSKLCHGKSREAAYRKAAEYWLKYRGEHK